MKKKLILLSDLWGRSDGSWINDYLSQLHQYFEIQYYDVRQLGDVSLMTTKQELIHQQFVDFGINQAIKQLINREPKRIDVVMGFSIGGYIAWKAIEQGWNVNRLIAVSATRLRYETKPTSCDCQLYFGAEDPYRPKDNWLNRMNIKFELIDAIGHDLYKDQKIAHKIIMDLKEAILNKKPIAENLKKLAYHSKWIEYDFLDLNVLEKQINEFDSGEDPHEEHHRYHSFLLWINKQESFTDLEIKNFIELINLDEDQSMASGALSRLFRSDKLSISQYLKVKTQMLTYGDWAKKLIKKVENVEQQSFNPDFCQTLELKINEFIQNSHDEQLQSIWCDGVNCSFVLKRELIVQKRIVTNAWLGVDGQDHYELTLNLGQQSLEKCLANESLHDCLPSDDLADWIQIDLVKKRVRMGLL